MDYWRNSRLRYGSSLEPELYSRLVAAGWISYAALLPVEKNRLRAYRKVEASHYPWVVQFNEKKPSIEERKRVLRKKLGMKEGEPDREFDFVDVVEGGEEDVVMAGPLKEEPTQIIEDVPSANPTEVVEQDAPPVAGPSTGTKRPRADSISAPAPAPDNSVPQALEPRVSPRRAIPAPHQTPPHNRTPRSHRYDHPAPPREADWRHNRREQRLHSYSSAPQANPPGPSSLQQAAALVDGRCEPGASVILDSVVLCFFLDCISCPSVLLCTV